MTKHQDQEYRDIFLAEALDQYSEINRFLTALERDPANEDAVHSLFRITHTLKGNAIGLGFEKISELAHVMEDLFSEVREGRIQLAPAVFSSLFKATDVLGELIDAIRNPREVKYRGIKTKLDVILGQARMSSAASNVAPNSESGMGGASSNAGADDDDDDRAESLSANLAFTDLVQVPVQKLDDLLNLVGELVIERDRIIASSASRSANEFSRLNRISSDLQYSVMDVRLVQVNFLFNKFHRVVRDAASKEEKLVRLRLEGAETEIDRNILQVISDSLIHLIRNAVGHGIELPSRRREQGKPEEGTITLSASSERDTVVIRIVDDGAGIDPSRIKEKAIEKGIITRPAADQMTPRDCMMLIFEAGFSTTEQVTAISGRGVGMDVVKKALDSIGGTVEVDSMLNEGTIVTLRLPSSMAVKSTLLFELETQAYAIPLSYIESVISIYKTDIHKAGNNLVAVHLGNTIHLVFLSDIFAQSSGGVRMRYQNFDQHHPEDKFEVAVVSFDGKRIGFIVDKLLQQKEIVEKALQKPFDRISFLSGVTILGNGNVCLVLSIPGILNAVYNAQSGKSNTVTL